MSEKNTKPKVSLVNRFLNVIEKVGNLLPHPAVLFAVMALLVIVVSAIVSSMGVSVVHPKTKETVEAFNLMSKEGLYRIITEMVTNFTSFAPLGTVLVALLGVGVAEGSGLIGVALRLVVLRSPERLLTFVVVFAGVVSNMASEVGYVLLVPLAAVIFLAAGRHPLAGLAAAFAGVSGGYSANLLLGTVDPLLAGLSTEAANIIDPAYYVNPACNYYFMIVSTFLIALLGTWVTEKIVIPKLGKYEGDIQAEKIEGVTKDEKRGLRFAGIAMCIVMLVILCGLVPKDGFLHTPVEELNSAASLKITAEQIAILNPDQAELFSSERVKSLGHRQLMGLLTDKMKTYTPEMGALLTAEQQELFVKPNLLNSMLMKGVVTFIFLIATIVGIAFGIGAKTFKNENDVMKGMAESMKTLGAYLVLVFFAAQFVAYFNWSNVGLISAVKGASFLGAIEMTGVPLVICFIVVAALMNLVMGSASAKWAIMAPVFIPMFMLLEGTPYSPEFTQLCYRVGDSVTNIISPMMSYFAIIIAFMQRYDKKAGIGTIISTMMPYSVVFFIGWVILLITWMLLGLPIGPDAPIHWAQ